MTTQQQGLITLVRSALTGQAYPLPADFDLADALAQAKRHGITALAFYGACNCGIDANTPAMQQAFLLVCRGISIAEKQNAEADNLLRMLEDQGIDHLPLKGLQNRKLYPKPEMRSMGDADILIRTEQYDRIRPLMLEAGYQEGVVSDHEFVWKKPTLYAELHRRLIPSYNRDYYAYFGDGWELAKPVSEGSARYTMAPEDELIYLFTHFAKHYRDSGIGIRHPVDIWVFEKHHPKLDRAYLQKELKKLQLWAFYRNTSRMLAVWFDGQSGDEKTDFMTNVIFTSGQYGKKETNMVSAALKETKTQKSLLLIRIRKILRSVFTPFPILREIYPVLKKAPILVPFIWFYHLIVRLTDRKKVTTYAKLISVDQGTISDYQRSLNYVGLDFNFGEDEPQIDQN